MSYQNSASTFTSANAAGAGAMEQMMVSMQKSMEEVQKTEGQVIQSTTVMAKAVHDAIESETTNQASEMKSQAIGTMVGGATSVVSAGFESANFQAGLSNSSLFDEAALNESYATSLEEGAPSDFQQAQVETAEGNQAGEAPADATETPEMQQEKAHKRAYCKALSEGLVKQSDEGNLNKNTDGTNKKQTQIDAEKKALTEASKNLDTETRNQHIQRFRAKAKALRTDAENKSRLIEQKSRMNQAYTQAGTQFSQGISGTIAAQSKQAAGAAQADAEVSRKTSQGIDKVEQTATTQRTEIGKALEQAAQSQRYYSQRG